MVREELGEAYEAEKCANSQKSSGLAIVINAL
jgi:hypothetical protein